MWVGVGNSGAIFTSSNGISWKKQSSGTTSGFGEFLIIVVLGLRVVVLEFLKVMMLSIGYNSIMVVKYVKLLALMV